MKSLKALNILMGIILMIGVAVAANNITTGCVLPNERLLASMFVYLSDYWFGPYKADIAYPAKTHTNPVTVSRIVIKDWGSPENFAYFSLIKGGPGKKYATISIQTQFGKSLNCTVDFFGYK